ncbi:DNA-binding transcriptional regulator, AcrR family [Thermomonospora echinospora]|uniref:DNA-binding transcriptional regulator, AcrR family n=1 Tax=Thermomonospora echinospora TaxID=1992 RepID=A0A1H6DLS6_9ACTN|nr:TetR/AcrR family transcriptional regulator [Thermomonospora echinospora]SEG86367.1 DNA-binding transcriptional regulator, AcrR family [Thermomonospora echinospora]
MAGDAAVTAAEKDAAAGEKAPDAPAEEITTSRSADAGWRWSDGYDPQRTRREIIDSALHLFEREGFDRTTLKQIVVGANLTKGAFYHHFRSKEDLLWHIQNEYLDTQIEAAREIVERGLDPVEQLRALIRLSLAGISTYRAHVAIFYQDRRHLTGDRLRSVTEKRDTLEAIFHETVQRGIDGGAFRREMNDRIITFGIFGLCASAFQWFNPDGSLGIDEVADQFCELVLVGLLTE